MMVVSAAAALAMLMVMVVSAAAAVVVVMVMPAATAFAMLMFMVVPAAAAVVVVMVMPAATAFARLMAMVVSAAAAVIVVMVVMSAATAAVAVTVTAAAAAAGVTRQGNGREGLVRLGDGEADVFQKALQLRNRHDRKAVFGLRNAQAARSEGVHGLLHESDVAGDLENVLGTGLDSVEAALFIDEDVAHFEGTHVAQCVFNGGAFNREGRGQRDALGHRQRDRLGAVNDHLRRSAVKREKFGDSHKCEMVNALGKRPCEWRVPRFVSRFQGAKKPTSGSHGLVDLDWCGHCSRYAPVAGKSTAARFAPPASIVIVS